MVKRPIATHLQADQEVFYAYESGILDSTECGFYVNHWAVIQGYGTDGVTGMDYWLVRNSWGTDWGENGFVRIAMTTEPADGMGRMIGICGVGYDPINLLFKPPHVYD